MDTEKVDAYVRPFRNRYAGRPEGFVYDFDADTSVGPHRVKKPPQHVLPGFTVPFPLGE